MKREPYDCHKERGEWHSEISWILTKEKSAWNSTSNYLETVTGNKLFIKCYALCRVGKNEKPPLQGISSRAMSLLEIRIQKSMLWRCLRIKENVFSSSPIFSYTYKQVVLPYQGFKVSLRIPGLIQYPLTLVDNLILAIELQKLTSNTHSVISIIFKFWCNTYNLF